MVGILGYGGGLISECYNTGKIEGTSYVGGIARDAAEIKNCYNAGSCSGREVGGLVGYDDECIISNSYNIAIISRNENASPGGYVGAIWGTKYGGTGEDYITNNYYLNTRKDGTIVMEKWIGNYSTVIEGIKAMKEEDMKTQNFVNSLNVTEDAIWSLDTKNLNNGFPVLSWQLQ